MASAPLRPGDPPRLGSYDLVGRLGAGGQGVVYLGRGPAGEQVAVKMLHGQVDGSFLLRELSMARQVASFCTAQILDADVAGDTPYIVSEYIEGRSLSDVVEADGPRTGGALERLAIGTATALSAIHQAGVVHRDFKPANVLLGPDGPRVIDFGIARALDVTATVGELRGTPAYMAPEQMNGQPAGPAADMFAWAVTIMFAATGRSPFGSDTLPAIIQRVLYSEPDVSVLPDRLRGLVTACLSKDPAARPAAQDVLIRLLGHTPAAPADALREGTTLSAGPAQAPTLPGTYAAPPAPSPSPFPPPSGPAVRRRGAGTTVLVAAGVIVLLGAGAAGALAVAGAFSSSPAPSAAPGRSTSASASGSAAGAGSSPGASPSGEPTAATTIPADWDGTWSGTGRQPTSTVNPTYSLTLTLRGGGTTGTTLYPSLGCQGRLTLVPGAPGGAVRLRERITAGGCTSAGEFVVRSSGGELSFSYQPDTPQSPSSFGTLTR
ncbi:serine/threonine-protein kinase [Actinomadura scrupuli]|uniref:serine/threonine-protein kinase n=1 Tax=Actinomadura scrupuli TaxID=559629 RepID=UPI003D968E30